MNRLHWLLVLLCTFSASACSTTSTSYTPLNCSPRLMFARSPEQVELFSSGPPARPHVDVGLITVEQGELGESTPQGLIQMLRRAAAQRGCDGLVVSAPSSRSETPFLSERTESYKVCSGTCIVYSIPGHS